MRLVFLGIFLFCILALVSPLTRALSAASEYGEARTIASGAANFKELKDRLASLAKKKGALYAFEVLERAELPPNTDLHLLGHAVGDVLYQQRGLGGIASCTQDFRNACSHAVVIGALNEYGSSSTTLRKIDDACKQAPGGSGAYTMCYHGLGHGVFAYFGYDLSKTVALCNRMGTSAYDDEQFTQCVSGAIMELTGGGGHDRDAWLTARQKYFVAEDPLSPCMSAVIPTRARFLCLLYITPQLFEFAGADIGHPDPSLFPKALSACDVIPRTQQRLRDACFGGFGKDFVPLAGARDIRDVANYTDDQFKEAIGWCALASQKDGREACIAEAVGSVFWGGENDPRASFRFCALAPDRDMQGACYRELARNIARYLPAHTELCAQLPAEQEVICRK